MRTNSPVDDNFGATRVPVDDSITPIQKLTKEDLNFAKIGRSADWGIIKAYIGSRIEDYKNQLFGEDLSGQPADTIGNRFLAAQAVVGEFEALIKKVDITTQAVVDAAKQSESQTADES